jgi:hypothetical protein
MQSKPTAVDAAPTTDLVLEQLPNREHAWLRVRDAGQR